MADKKNLKFGDVFFAELNQDAYLKKIYEDILYNYAIKVFGFNKRRKREIPINDALAFADLLSKSNHATLYDSQKMWAQEIVTMLHYIYPEDKKVSYIAGSVLSSIGNYQGTNIVKSSFDGVGTLDKIFAGYKKEYYTIPADPEKQFMSAQKIVYDHFADEYYSYSGPTSMGKSYIMRMFIKQQIFSGVKNNFALVVPTKALINEVRIKITDDLQYMLHENNYHIVTAAGDAVLIKNSEENSERRYIFIMTPERLLYLLINEQNIQLDYLFIDEAHKLSGADNRSPFYYQIVHMLSEREHRPHFVFASPNVPNPEIYLSLIAGVESNELKKQKLASAFSPVSQVKFLINLDDNEVDVYNEHTKETVPLTSIALEDADLTDVLLRFEKDDKGAERQCIIYFPSTRKTVVAARDFAANRVEKSNDKELIELAKDIKNDIHGDYYLAELISKGVAYHIGYLPASIRQRIEDLFRAGSITALFCTSTLVEGVNLPADNLFITDFKNGSKHMKAVDFRNLIGRVGRLEYNLYGNVFLVASSEKANEKYVSLLQEDIAPQTLSIEKGLTKPQKQNVIEALLHGTVELVKYPDKQSADSYDLMRKFAIILLNDILKNRTSRVRQEFQQLMNPGDEDKIRTLFASNEEYIQDDDITISVDQSESLYQAILQNGLEFPAVDEQGNFDSAQLLAFLERLCRIFKWEIYESETLGHVGKYSKKHGRLSWYAVILSQWVQGDGLNKIMFQAISYKQRNPENALYIDNNYVDYNDTREHRNIVISDVLSVIDKVILFKISNYFLKVSKAYKEIRQVEKVPNDWYEFVEYGSTNRKIINIQKHGFSRESSLYILNHGKDYIAQTEPELKLKKSLLECSNEGVKKDAAIIKYNIPDLFVD
ncbi:DEAD/DEAH box helicase [Clostridium sp. BJN0013]|uniref:DEAD/DEAH box helicase n=1 Tax=Clostridium sp. BJN0013 TaxID=3236840 RepID=UPI0034C5F86E